MSVVSENQVTAALAFAVPQKVGWSVQNDDQSRTGSELLDLVDCLAQNSNKPQIVSLSLIFKLPGNEGTVRT